MAHSFHQPAPVANRNYFLVVGHQKENTVYFHFYLLGRENIMTTTRFKSSIVHCFYTEKKA